ncbi:MAG: cupin domain-containing protein [Cyanobium sp.]
MLEPASLLPLAALLLPPAMVLGSMAPAAFSQPAAEVVPAHERLNSGQGANVTQGVVAIKRLGGQPLGEEFAALQGRELRLREITVATGGSIALHRHDRRPGVAYILEGQMTERRGPGFTPRVYGPGQVAFEGHGVTHWWRNEGSTPSRALVVDIVPIAMP